MIKISYYSYLFIYLCVEVSNEEEFLRTAKGCMYSSDLSKFIFNDHEIKSDNVISTNAWRAR